MCGTCVEHVWNMCRPCSCACSCSSCAGGVCKFVLADQAATLCRAGTTSRSGTAGRSGPLPKLCSVVAALCHGPWPRWTTSAVGLCQAPPRHALQQVKSPHPDSLQQQTLARQRTASADDHFGRRSFPDSFGRGPALHQAM